MQNEFGIYSGVPLLNSFQLKGKEKELGLQLSDSGKVRCLHTLNVQLSHMKGHKWPGVFSYLPGGSTTVPHRPTISLVCGKGLTFLPLLNAHTDTHTHTMHTAYLFITELLSGWSQSIRIIMRDYVCYNPVYLGTIFSFKEMRSDYWELRKISCNKYTIGF